MVHHTRTDENHSYEEHSHYTFSSGLLIWAHPFFLIFLLILSLIRQGPLLSRSAKCCWGTTMTRNRNFFLSEFNWTKGIRFATTFHHVVVYLYCLSLCWGIDFGSLVWDFCCIGATCVYLPEIESALQQFVDYITPKHGCWNQNFR